MKQIKYTNNKEYKRYLSNKGKIRCSICPYNRRENLKRNDRKSWKHRNRCKKQWMCGSKFSRKFYKYLWK